MQTNFSHIISFKVASYSQRPVISVCNRTTQITIIDASTDAKHFRRDSTCCFTTYAYDRNDATFDHVYPSLNGMMKYEVEESDVWTVFIQNRPDCCGKQKTLFGKFRH